MARYCNLNYFIFTFVILNTIKSINLDSREADPNPKNKKLKIKSWRRKRCFKRLQVLYCIIEYACNALDGNRRICLSILYL
jgi:hypothetical protein